MASRPSSKHSKSPSSTSTSLSSTSSPTTSHSSLSSSPSPSSSSLSLNSDYMNILQISEMLSSNMSTDKIVQRVVDACAFVLQSECMSLWSVSSPPHNIIRCTYSKTTSSSPSSSAAGPTHSTAPTNSPLSPSPPLIGQERSNEQGIVGYIVNGGTEVCINGNVLGDWRYNEESDGRGPMEIRSLLSVPVRNGEGKTVAILEAINSCRGGGDQGFIATDSMFLKAMAASISSIMKKQEIQADLNLNIAHTRAQQHIHSLLSASAEVGLSRAIEIVEDVSRTVVGAKVAQVWFLDHDTKTLTCRERERSKLIERDEEEGAGDSLPSSSHPSISRNVSEYSLAKIEEVKLTIGEGPVGLCALRGELINIPPSFSSSSSRLIVPIKDFLGRIMAVIEAKEKLSDSELAASSSSFTINSISPTPTTPPTSVLNGEEEAPRSFTSEDEFLLTSLSQTATSVLRNALLCDEASSRARQTQTLLHIIELMSIANNSINTQSIITRIIDAAYKLMNCDRITLFMVQDKQDLNNEVHIIHNHMNSSIILNEDKEKEAANSASLPPVSSSIAVQINSPPPRNPTGGFFTSATSPLSQLAQLPTVPKQKGPHKIIRAVSATKETEKELVCVVSKDESMRGRRIAIGEGLVGTCALTLKPINSGDAYADHRFSSSNDKKNNFKTKSLLTVPVVDSEGRCVAVIQAINRREDGHNRGAETFSSEDEQILQSLANSAGIMFSKNNMIQATSQAEKKSGALLKLLDVVSNDEQLSLYEVLDGIVEVTYQAIDCDRITMYFVEAKELFSIVSKDVTGVRFPLGKGIAGYAALNGVGLNIKDAHKDMRFDKSFDVKTGYRTQSVLCMPIKSIDGKVLAVIQLLNKKKEKRINNATVAPSSDFTIFTREDEGVLAAICEQISDCIRKHMSEALQIHYSANPRIHSLMNLYMGEGLRSQYSSIMGSRMGSRIHSRRTSRDLSHVFSNPCSPPSDLISPPVPRPPPTEAELADIQHGVYHRRSRSGFFSFPAGTASPSSPHSHPLTPPKIIQPPTPGTGTEGEVALMDLSLFRECYQWLVPNTAPVPNGGRLLFDEQKDYNKIPISFPSPPKALYEWTEIQLAELEDVNFDVFSYSDEQLISSISIMFNISGLSNVFGIKPSLFQRFAMRVRGGYRDNPFHNFKHGFACLHYCFLLLRQTNVCDYLHFIHVLGLFISTLSHDIDHRGRTNTFEVNKETDIALAHNDVSVLENHHCFTTFQLLRDPHTGVYQHLSVPDRRQLRTILIQSFFATDMSTHFDKIKLLATLKELGNLDPNEEKNRMLMVQLVIHTADLSGQTLSWPLAREWEDRIVQEFSAQAEEEKALGMTTEPFMQGLEDEGHRAQLQVNFINFVLEPWYSHMARLIPGIQPFFAQLLANKAKFAEIAEKANGKHKN